MKHPADNPGAVFWFVMVAARGLAFFVAAYTLLSLLALAIGNHYNLNTWWIDLSFLPTPLGPLLQLVMALLVGTFALRLPPGSRRLKHIAPKSRSRSQVRIARFSGYLQSIGGFLGRIRRWSTAAACALFALFALQNVAGVYAAERAGEVRLGSPVPFSLFIVFGFVLLALAVMVSRDAQGAKPPRKALTIGGMMLTVLLMVGLFPLGQILCFGTTDYRGRMDAAVVLGAQVLPDGSLSLALRGRVDTACELYEQGLTPVLIMSGGTDVEGTSEALAMRDYAVARGVPQQAILVDTQGMNTQATVLNTLEIIREHDFQTVGAVSTFYHLARIKMLYLDEGLDVRTIPAQIDARDRSAALASLREIPGWWYYWFKGVLGQ
jgi:vancomycin permeability regulator SanA/uncharacterized membrane protein